MQSIKFSKLSTYFHSPIKKMKGFFNCISNFYKQSSFEKAYSANVAEEILNLAKEHDVTYEYVLMQPNGKDIEAFMMKK